MIFVEDAVIVCLVPKDIQINQCARMSLMLRRAPAASWLNDHWQNEMEKNRRMFKLWKMYDKMSISFKHT